MLRVLLLADTHLGFDLPWKPRVERRRRGPDFFANYRRALAPARRGEVDLVVHGGDVLFGSKNQAAASSFSSSRLPIIFLITGVNTRKTPPETITMVATVLNSDGSGISSM